MAASSSYVPKKMYDVFISFRGEDTRHNFTSHLHASLRRRQVKSYIDEEDLDRGEEISPGLERAIEESQLSVIVFSENYASSSWCLDELLHILRCKGNDRRHVVPVFYGVDPSHVRKQLGSYKEAFDKHEERYKHDADKVQKWRLALKNVADFSGFSTRDIRSESQLVEAIVEDIIKKLNGVSLFSFDCMNLVGIEQPVKQIESMLQVDLLDVRVIGLWGRGGIGKTTLARFLLCKLYSKFDAHCFLGNIREEWEKCREKYHLQFKIISDLLAEKGTYKDIGSAIPTFSKDRLGRAKSLIVLDDVNDREQLEYLVGCGERYGSGSRIIVTSRDVQSLRSHLVHAIYEVKGLNSYDAHRLFCLNAQNSQVPYPEDLLESVIQYAEGIPLLLNVLRSLFNHNGNENWETLLNKLKNSRAGEKIQNALMISYDDLSIRQKSIFLDIACFFKGWNRHHVERILDEPGFTVESAIDDLVNKSLITITYCKQLCMHDLVQEMGQEVIRRRSSKPGKRSRLCNAQDICLVFKSNTATEEIEGIFLDVSKIKEVNLNPYVFQHTNNLRLLKIYNSNNIQKCKVYLPEGLQYLPDSLRYFYWEEYPSKSLPFGFAPEYLVELIMPHSQVEKLWDGVQRFWSLRTINLSNSKKLTEMPDLSEAQKLVTINFSWCSSLFHVPSHNFENLDRLVDLDLSGCEKLQTLPASIHTVKYLYLWGCKDLENMPEIKEKNVVCLYLSKSGIKELPASIGSFCHLMQLELQHCKSLKNFPSQICQLNSLTSLNLSGCSSIKEIPELPRNLSSLCMSRTAIEEVPSSIELLSGLHRFDLSNCKRLWSLPTSICKLKFLGLLDLRGCSKFEDFPEILEPMRHLYKLDLSGTAIRTLPSSIENLIHLEKLGLGLCEKLEFVTSSVYKLKRLERLDLCGFSGLLKWPFPMVGRFSNLSELYLLDCKMSEMPDNWLGCFESVRDLHVSIQNLDAIPASMARFPNLRYLAISNWKNLRSLPELPCNIEILDAQGCTSLESVPSSRNAIIKGFLDRKDWCSTHLLFLNCLKLDQNARDNIIADGQLRILRTAVNVLSGFGSYRPSRICYPGNEIPEWFPSQATGSSINIKLSSNWWNTKFLGFSICFVAAFEEHDYNELGLRFEVVFQWNTNSGESCISRYHLIATLDDILDCNRPRIISSDHVFMWYEYNSFIEVSQVATEVSFHFCPVQECDSLRSVESCKLKRCGIRLLYLQDVEELGVSFSPDYWEPEVEGRSKRRAIVEYANPRGNELVLCDSATKEEEEGRSKRRKIDLNANPYQSETVLLDSGTERERDHGSIRKIVSYEESGFNNGSDAAIVEEIMIPTSPPPCWASPQPQMNEFYQNHQSLQYHQETAISSSPPGFSIHPNQPQALQFIGMSGFPVYQQSHEHPSSSAQYVSSDPIFQSSHANGGDWQDEVYQEQEQGHLMSPDQVQSHGNFHFQSINAQFSTSTMHENYVHASLPEASTTQQLIMMYSWQQQIFQYQQMATASLPPRFPTHPMVPHHPYNQPQMLQYPQPMMSLSPSLPSFSGFPAQQPDEGPSSSTQYWSNSAAPDLSGTGEGNFDLQFSCRLGTLW